MSQNNKDQFASNAGAPVPGGNRIDPRQEIEPVAERRPVPVFIIILLVLLIYGGDMYIMEHGADVLGKAGPFPKEVFDPYRTYQEIVDKNPESPEEKAIRIGRVKYELYCS